MSVEPCVFHGGNGTGEACLICHPVSSPSSLKIDNGCKHRKVAWQGMKLKERRKELGFTMDELSRLIGCTRALVSIWEDGKSVPGGDLLVLLSEVLKKEPKYFFERKDNTINPVSAEKPQ